MDGCFLRYVICVRLYIGNVKYLGSFSYEAYDSKFFLRGLKAYQYIDIKGNVAGVCGHIAKNDPRRKEFGKIPEVKGNVSEPVFIDEDGTIKNIF